MPDVRRREFISLLGGAATAWPLAARAQQGERVRRIGVLIASVESDPERQKDVKAFQDALQDLGWIDGRNIQIDIRWAPERESMQRSAKDLVALQPHVILAPTTSATQQSFSKRALFPPFSPFQTIAWAVASCKASPGPAAMSLVSSIWNQRWPASGWSCSRRLHRARPGSRCCSTRQ